MLISKTINLVLGFLCLEFCPFNELNPILITSKSEALKKRAFSSQRPKGGVETKSSLGALAPSKQTNEVECVSY